MANERVLVVGAGGISNAWFPNLKHEQLEVVGVVDLRREAAQAQIDKYQLKGPSRSIRSMRHWPRRRRTLPST